MLAAYITHPDCARHEMGPGHPECPERLGAIQDQLLIKGLLDYMVPYDAPLATDEQLCRAHSTLHVRTIVESAPADGYHHVDPDTNMNRHTLQAARRAAGAAVEATDLVLGGKVSAAFCAVRPPGHHAEYDAVEGFCLFSNAAIGALHAKHVHGLTRIAVIDFDVHHGNGTQEVLWNEPGTFYASTHQQDAYPYTGAMSEIGPEGGCVVVNVPLPAGSGSDDFRTAYSDIILPKLRAFAPELVIVSAGFDGHAADPMANLRLQVADFDWVTRGLLQIAAECCQRRLVSVLEGGYDTRALAACVASHVRVLMDA